MYVKLFVVHFTIIGAFAHLRHLRRESSWPLVYIGIIANPIAGMGLILLLLILLLFQAILCHGDRTALRDSTCILLGSGSQDADSEYSIPPEGPSLTWPKLSKDLATKMILQLALMTQCITSIWLFSRRVKHYSDALYDDKVLQLALLGLSVSVMSIIHLICQPQYPSMAYLHQSCMRISWLSCLRPLPKKYSNCYRKLVLGMMEMFLYWLFAAIILPLAKVVGLMYLNPPWLTIGIFWGFSKYNFLLLVLMSLGVGFDNSPFFGSPQRQSQLQAGIFDIFKFLILGLIWIGFIDSPILGSLQRQSHVKAGIFETFKYPILISIWAGINKSPFFESPQRQSHLKAKVLDTAIIALTMISLISLCDYIWQFFAVWFLLTPMYGYSQLQSLLGLPANHKTLSNAVYDPNDSSTMVPDWNSIWTFGHAPASFPCPGAWKDPMADYVWWLA